jgi:hypothetical protein
MPHWKQRYDWLKVLVDQYPNVVGQLAGDEGTDKYAPIVRELVSQILHRLVEISNVSELPQPNYSRRPTNIGPLSARNLQAVSSVVDGTPLAKGTRELISVMERLAQGAQLGQETLTFLGIVLEQVPGIACAPESGRRPFLEQAVAEARKEVGTGGPVASTLNPLARVIAGIVGFYPLLDAVAVGQLSVPITGFLDACVQFVSTGDPVKRQEVAFSLEKLRLFLEAKVETPAEVTAQALETIVALLTALTNGQTQGVANAVVALVVLRAAAQQANISDPALGRVQAVLTPLQRVLPGLPPGGFDPRALPGTDSRVIIEARGALVELVTDLSTKSTSQIAAADSLEALLALQASVNDDQIPAAVLAGQAFTPETAKQTLKASTLRLLFALRGFQLAKSPSLDQCFSFIKLTAYLLRTLTVLLSKNTQEGVRALQRYNARCFDYVEEIALEGDLPPLSGLKDEQRSTIKVLITVIGAIIEINATRAVAVIEEAWRSFQQRQQGTFMQANSDFTSRVGILSRLNRNTAVASKMQPIVNAFYERLRKFTAGMAAPDMNSVLPLEYYVIEAIYSLAQLVIEMDDSSQLVFDPENAAKLPRAFEVPAVVGGAVGDAQLVPTLYRIAQNLKQYRDLYWNPVPNTQLVSGIELFFNDAKIVIIETIRLSGMSISLGNSLALRESAKKFGAVVNGLLTALRGKLLANPSWMSDCDASFMQIAPTLEAIRKLTEETRQILEKGAPFLRQYGQIVTGLRQALPQLDIIVETLHKEELTEARELAVAVIDLVRQALVAVQQSFMHGNDISSTPASLPKVATALLTILRGLLDRPAADAIAVVIPQIDEALKELDVGFPESPEGTRLNAEAKRIIVSSRKLGLRLGRLKAEIAKLQEGVAITPFTNAELHGWFVERLALESKVQSNEWELEGLQKELSVITSS